PRPQRRRLPPRHRPDLPPSPACAVWRGSGGGEAAFGRRRWHNHRGMMACGQSGGRRGLLLLIVVPVSLWLAACGGSARGDPASGRTYASAYTHQTAQGIPLNVTCTHAEDGGGFDRTCTGDLPTVEHWAPSGGSMEQAAQ